MKKALVIVLAVLACAAVFAEGWEVGASFSPYGYYVNYVDGKKADETTYAFAFTAQADYYFDNGFFTGAGVAAGRLTYKTEAKWAFVNLYGFGGYAFPVTENLYLSASVGLGAELSSEDDETLNSFAVTAGVEADYYFKDNVALTFGVEYEYDYNKAAKETESGFCFDFGILYEL